MAIKKQFVKTKPFVKLRSRKEADEVAVMEILQLEPEKV
jgi:hypothetical protein